MVKAVNFPRWWRFGAFTFWRWVFIRPELANNVPLIAHEQAHLDDQRNWLGLPSWLSLFSALLWVLMYFLPFPYFRFTAEVIGFSAQVKAGGCTVSWAAIQIVDKYWTFCTVTEAKQAIEKELNRISRG